MLNVKKLLAMNLERIRVETYDLGDASYTQGSIGTVAKMLEQDIMIPGYTPVLCSVQFVAASTVSFVPMFNGDRGKLLVQVVRRSTLANTYNFKLYGIVLYVKE